MAPRKTKVEEIVDLDAFKERVVKVALKYADEYDWCDTVNDALEEMGLKDLLPAKYVVEQKSQYARSTWIEYYSASTEQEAVSNYQRYRQNNNGVYLDPPDISLLMTEEEALESLRKWRANNKEVIDRAKAQPTSYPIYRIVVKGGKNDGKVLLEETIQQRTAKKTVAKKATKRTAKKTAARRRA
jgi:hypothetical protein